MALYKFTYLLTYLLYLRYKAWTWVIVSRNPENIMFIIKGGKIPHRVVPRRTWAHERRAYVRNHLTGEIKREKALHVCTLWTGVHTKLSSQQLEGHSVPGRAHSSDRGRTTGSIGTSLPTLQHGVLFIPNCWSPAKFHPDSSATLYAVDKCRRPRRDFDSTAVR